MMICQEASGPTREGGSAQPLLSSHISCMNMYEAHMPLSGYNIIFQSHTDYFSMEGKWLGENPSTNAKWHDSGLKEPACFHLPPPPSPFSLPSQKQTNNWKLTARNRSPYLLHCFDTCSHCYLGAVNGVRQTSRL